ncbi:proton-conducting transporter membrane subunit [Rhodoblastus sp.]|uniref:proton-conducting transporter transmembrane domain-containing protein n=1 Tax=Rhodoblastus sp. TaxID=1962975 RepID=UPI0035B4B041
MTSLPSLLLVATLAVPLALLAACFVADWRPRALALQGFAPIPALAAGLFGMSATPLSFDWSGLGFTLRLDPPGALLLAVAALLWIATSLALYRDRAADERFGLCWLLTMIGSLGVFVAGDLVSFYLVYALVSIPAYGLFAFSDNAEKKRAGAIYLAFALAGEAVLLLAFALLAANAPQGGARIADVVATLPASPWRDATLALIVAGFGMKLGLVPFNGWMPLNYAAAPIPAAAVLSGAGVKAAVIGLIRFLPLGVPLAGWGEAVTALGFLTAFYGVVLGLTQDNPKTILAYSSISQMGVIAAALGMGLTAGDASASGDVAFYAANHLLVKAALFVTIGALAARAAPLAGWTLTLAATLALSLAGLPLTGGALAKLASKAQFAQGWPAVLATLSSIGTALLMTHFLARLAWPPPESADETPPSLVRFWPAVALGAILLPWSFASSFGDPAKALEWGKLWDGLWPVAVGVALAFGLRRIGWPLPKIPAGDSIVFYEAAFRRLLALGPVAEKTDARLRQWPAAGVSLLAIILALLAGALSGR